MNDNALRKNEDTGLWSRLRNAWSSGGKKKLHYARHARVTSYSVSGNGVAYRKASDYLRDKKVVDFLEEAENVRVAR